MAWTSWGASGQSATRPSFETASVKPNKSGSGSASENETNGRLSATNITLRDCLKLAYGLKSYQISGPAWLSEERYDIAAKAPDHTASGQLMAMLQTLLTERFSLMLHRDRQELPVYALVVGKNGSKLQAVSAGDIQSRLRRDNATATLTGTKMSMADLADSLSGQVDRPVVDKTGLTGVFDVTLKWTPAEKHATPDPALFTAIEEQLGLKLEAEKDLVEVLIIDHAEKVPAGEL
jgi:uncharacterized protein (TIGR03435 family)